MDPPLSPSTNAILYEYGWTSTSFNVYKTEYSSVDNALVFATMPATNTNKLFAISYLFENPVGTHYFISYSASQGYNYFGNMRVSQQTGYVYLCNYEPVKGYLEFHRMKHGITLT